MTNFLNINNYDLKLYYEVLEPFLEEHNNTVEEEGVWEVIRGLDYEELPILANVIYQIAFKKLENILHTNYHHELEIDYYINCRDTHLVIDDIEIHEYNDLKFTINNIEK